MTRPLTGTILSLVMSLALLGVVTGDAQGQVSIGSLRASVASANLELFTLQGVVHLVRSHRPQLGGTCGATAFTLVDETGSIEVTVRRAGRLVKPLREGDRVQVIAQVHVFRDQEQVPLLICIDATEIQHLAK